MYKMLIYYYSALAQNKNNFTKRGICMARKSFIAGNWKMNNTIEQGVNLVNALKAAKNKNNADIMVAPSFTAINAVAQALKGTGFIVAAQDCYFEEKGAFTSQVSPSQIKEAGATAVILGHSERRALFGDTNEILNKKIAAALRHGLQVIYCVGETLAQREANQIEQVITSQLEEGLKGYTAEELKTLVIAYEPVWAIGTGKTATPEQAEEVHALIRKVLTKMLGAEFANNIRILYGGSVKAENVDSIMAKENVDGVLVGGQALIAEKFIRIIDYE